MSAGRALHRSAAFANGGVVREVLGLAFWARQDHILDIRAIFRNSRYASSLLLKDEDDSL